MSRFPAPANYSGLSDAVPTRSATRRGGVPSVGPAPGLIAPGLSVVPPVITDGFDNSELAATVAALGQAVDTYSVDAYRKQQRAAAEQAKAERATEQAQTLLRGQGAERSQTDVPGLIADIETGKIVATDEEARDPRAFIERLANEKLAGQDPLIREGWIKAANGPLSNALANRLVKGHAAALQSGLRAAGGAAMNADDPAGLASAYDAAVKLGVSPEDAFDATYHEALRYAASTGDANRYAMVRGTIDAGKYPGELAAADAVHAKAQAQLRAAADQASDDRFYAAFDGYKQGTVSEASVAKMIDDEKGYVTPEVTMRRRDALRSESEKRAKESARAVRQTEIEEADRIGLQLATTAARSGQLRGFRGYTVGLSDGTTHLIEAKKVEQEALRNVFAEIDREPGTDPVTKMRQKIGVMRQNAVIADDLIPGLEAAYQKMSDPVMVMGPSDGPQNTPIELPEDSVAGFQLYQLMHNDWRQGLSGLSADATKIFDAAMVAKRIDTIGGTSALSDQQALVAAMSNLRKPTAVQLSPAESQQIARAAKALSADASNVGDLQSVLEEEVRFMARAGNPVKAALEQRVKSYEDRVLNINGFAHLVADARIKKEEFPLIKLAAQDAIDDYAKSSPAPFNDPSMLTMIPNGAGGLILAYQNGMPVLPNGRTKVWGMNELLELGRAIDPVKAKQRLLEMSRPTSNRDRVLFTTEVNVP